MTPSSLRLEILGTTSDRIGPFALLGLTPERCEPHHVRTAVESLLARVDRQASSADPAAAALRREIHAAAALLLDPAARGELIADYQQARHGTTEGSSYDLTLTPAPPRAVADANGAPRGAAGSPNYPPAFLRDLLAAWVSAGGWNGQARHRIIAAGVQHGISGEALLDAIVTLPAILASPRETPLVGPPPVGLAGGSAAAMISLPASLSILAVRDAHETAKRNLFAAVLAFLACAAVVIPFAAWVIFQINVMGPRPDPSLASPAPAPIAPSNANVAPLLPTVAREDIAIAINPMSQTFAGLLESLDRDSTLATSLDQSVLGLFTSATTQGRREWTQFNAEARERLRDVLVSAVYRLGRDESSARTLVDLIDPAESPSLVVEGIAGRAWSIGMLVVMMREPDLPAAARQVVEQHWRRHVPTGTPPQSADFNAAARFALREMIAPLVGSMAASALTVELWVTWLQCMTSVADEDQAEALALESARQVLVDGPDISASEGAGRVMAAIFSAVRWKTSPAARAALLSWWDEPRVSPADLAVVSSWIVSTGAIPGLDDSFIVPPGASAEVRAALRQKLAEAWSSTTVAPGEGGVATRTEIADWIARSERLLNESALASPEGLLAQTITVAFHNSAASMLWSGRPEIASSLLADAEARLAAARLATTATPAPVAPPRGSDGQWAIRYFRASKENDREGLNRLIESLATEQPGDLGPIDAAILADIALSGQPREMRAAALDQIVAAYGNGPTVLLTLADKMIPDRSDSTLSQAIERLTGEDLPEPRREDWYTRARLALIQRVAELRGSRAADSGVDALAALLAEVYADRLVRPVGPDLLSVSMSVMSPAEAAQRTFEQWIEIGRPMQPLAPLPAPLHQIEHRAVIRAALLDDPIGRFHAWQIGSLEAACYVASAERPAARQALADLLATTTLRLAVARNVMEQLLVAERALLKVWEIRFGFVAEGGRL